MARRIRRINFSRERHTMSMRSQVALDEPPRSQAGTAARKQCLLNFCPGPPGALLSTCPEFRARRLWQLWRIGARRLGDFSARTKTGAMEPIRRETLLSSTSNREVPPTLIPAGQRYGSSLRSRANKEVRLQRVTDTCFFAFRT